jgi:hypothetical protein
MSESDVVGFPSILMPVEPDESILGYIWRNSMTSGRRRMKDHVDYLVARQALEPPWVVPSNLPMLCESLTPVFASADDILRNHTCLPAFLPFAGPVALPRVMAHVMQGQEHSGVPSLLGLAGKFVCSKPVMALCTACAQEDEHRLGFTYWRRSHNLPGLTYCLQHGQQLVAGCGKCAFSSKKSRTPRLPAQACWCGARHTPLAAPEMPVDVAVLMTLAKLAHQLLQGALAGRTSAEIGAYFDWQARQAGFGAGTRLKTPRITAIVRESYSQELLSHLNAAFGTNRTNWLEVALGARMPPIVMTRNLLLFHFFGKQLPSQEDFEQARQAADKLSELRLLCREPSTSAPRYDRDKGRRKILQYLATDPRAGRQEALLALGRTAMNARAYDFEWYSSTLRSRRGRDPLTSEKREAYSLNFDRRTAAHIRSQHTVLMDPTGQPKQITRRALLMGCARGNEVTTERLALMPLTRGALQECVEERNAFQERYAVWILQNTPAHLDRHAQAQRRTGLSMEQIDRLVAKLMARNFA